MNKNRDLDIARKAASEGVRVIKEFKKNGFEVRQKGFHDLITDADIAAEEAILSVIRNSFPNDDILAEESASYGSLTENRTWIIDPIDGTTNFAHDFPVYCTSVALWVNKQPRVGVVVEVTRDEEFSALAGEGAWLNGRAISVSGTKNPRDGFVGTGFPYDDLSLVNSYLGLFKVLMKELQGIRRPGSAAFDLCCVACGRFDGFYEYSLHIWDLAAASLIIKEAGGVITDWNGGEGWPFGQRIIAGNEHLHRYLKKMIQEYIPEKDRENVA